MQDLKDDPDLKEDPTVLPMWVDDTGEDADIEIRAALNSQKHTKFGLGKHNENKETRLFSKAGGSASRSLLSGNTGYSSSGALNNLQRVGLSGAQHVYKEDGDNWPERFEREARLDLDVVRDAIRSQWSRAGYATTIGAEAHMHIQDGATLKKAVKAVVNVAKKLAPAIFFAQYVYGGTECRRRNRTGKNSRRAAQDRPALPRSLVRMAEDSARPHETNDRRNTRADLSF